MHSFYRIVILSLLTVLTSCATLSPTDTPATQLAQKLDQATLAQLEMLLTTRDNPQTTWQNSEGNINYQMMSNPIYINAKGQPCRSYQLQVHQNYQRPWFTQGTICRDDEGKWQMIPGVS